MTPRSADRGVTLYGLRARMTKSEFKEMMTLLVSRSSTQTVLGYESSSDIDNRSVTMVYVAMGHLVLDYLYAPVTREGGSSSTPLYDLTEIDDWPIGLFESVTSYTWIIDQELNVLDVIARAV